MASKVALVDDEEDEVNNYAYSELRNLSADKIILLKS